MLKCYSGEYKITDFQAWNNCLRRALRITLRLLWINCFCCWVTQSCPTLCDPMDCSTPGFPIHHQLPECDWESIESVMPSNHLILCHSLLLPSVFPSIRVFSKESVLCIRWPKYWSFSFSLPVNIQDWFPVGLTDLISLQSKRLSRVFTNTTVQKHQFFGIQLSLRSNSHIHTWLLEKL